MAYYYSAVYTRLQPDGNLVIYTTAGRALWASNTAGNNVAYLAMQDDSNCVLYRVDGQPLWASNTRQ